MFQDFILEHYSEDGGNYEEAIAELMETRQVKFLSFFSNEKNYTYRLCQCLFWFV